MVYEASDDSYMLASVVKKYAFGRVLDMGTGSGVLALEASKKKNVSSVVAVDVDTSACSYVKGLKIRKITVKQSNLFSTVRGKFDTIIFNPPYLPQDKGIADITLYGGKKGYEVSVRFLEEISSYLEPNGVLLFLFSSLTKKDKIDEVLDHQLLDYSIAV